MHTFSLLFLWFFITAQALAADNVVINPRPNEDTVIKANNTSEPTKPADGTQEVLRVKGANSTAIFANGVGSTDSSASSPTIDSGETVSKSNIVIPAAETWTVNGALNTTGLISGAGAIAGTGTVTSIDAGANGDDVVFGGNIDVIGELNGAKLGSVSSLSGDYTITDTDGIQTFLMTTGSSNKTITLPTLADNVNRYLRFKKVDAGSGWLLLDGEGAETLEGVSVGYLPSQNDYVHLLGTSSEWKVIEQKFAPLGIFNQEASSIANATVTDMGSDTLTIPPGKYLVSMFGRLSAYFNPLPTFVSTNLRVTDLANAFITDDDGTNMNGGQGAAQGETGAGGNQYAVQVSHIDMVKTVTSTLTVKMRCYYRNSGGTEVIARGCQDGQTVWKKIAL